MQRKIYNLNFTRINVTWYNYTNKQSTKDDYTKYWGKGDCIMQCRLKELRLSRGLSQEGLAQLINTSQQTISRVEAGITDLAAGVAVRAADYFQVSVEYILGLTEEKEKESTVDKAMHIYKQHEEFFTEFEKLNSHQKDAVKKIIHELLIKQREIEEQEEK